MRERDRKKYKKSILISRSIDIDTHSFVIFRTHIDSHYNHNGTFRYNQHQALTFTNCIDLLSFFSNMKSVILSNMEVSEMEEHNNREKK